MVARPCRFCDGGHGGIRVRDPSPGKGGWVFRYHFGGVELASEIALTGLRPAGEADPAAHWIHVLPGQGACPEEDRFHFAWGGRFPMRLGEAGGQWLVTSLWGNFLFDPEVSTVRVFAAPGADGAALKSLFARRLLPRLVKRKGGTAYHAASLAKQGKGIMLLGRSGAGKSTTTAGLAMMGWDVLGDDMALVRGEAERRLLPNAADVSIWPRSSTGLGIAEQDLAPLSGSDGKLLFHPRGAASLASAPLAGIFFLNRVEDAAPGLVRCARAEAFGQALGQIIYFNPSGTAVQERLDSVTGLNTLLRDVPSWTLTYPASFSVYPSLSEMILSALDAAPETHGVTQG
jgi:hypothetical protein